QHGGREKARADARDVADRARKAGAPRSRRQSAGGLERPDDCRAGQCRPRVRGTALARNGRARFPVRRRQDCPWRPAPAFPAPGHASDHAAMIRAALALHEATGEQAHLERALAWQATLDRHYANADNGGYFLTADDAAGLVVRPNATTDDATPNPNALAAQNL